MWSYFFLTASTEGSYSLPIPCSAAEAMGLSRVSFFSLTRARLLVSMKGKGMALQIFLPLSFLSLVSESVVASSWGIPLCRSAYRSDVVFAALHGISEMWSIEHGFSTLGILAPCFSQVVGDTSRFYSFLSLSLFFNRRGKGVNQHESSHNQKVPFFSLPNVEKKKAKWGEEKRALLGRFFNWPLFFSV